MENLVSTDWLHTQLYREDLRIVDASWYLPQMNRNGRAEYAEGHIPGAVFFDIDEIADLETDLPHMLPPAEKFAQRVRKLGLADGARIVVYDGMGVFSAARVWWMFKVFGHADVAVLDGGLPKWIAEERPLRTLPECSRERHFSAKLNKSMVRSFEDMQKIVEAQNAQIVDARDRKRFAGEAPEPRDGLRSGNIPGSKNLPFMELFAEDGTILPAEQIRNHFEKAGVDLAKPVITSCGSGVTAAVLSLALDLIGHQDHALYDGSWTEWGSRNT